MHLLVKERGRKIFVLNIAINRVKLKNLEYENHENLKFIKRFLKEYLNDLKNKIYLFINYEYKYKLYSNYIRTE